MHVILSSWLLRQSTRLLGMFVVYLFDCCNILINSVNPVAHPIRARSKRTTHLASFVNMAELTFHWSHLVSISNLTNITPRKFVKVHSKNLFSVESRNVKRNSMMI